MKVSLANGPVSWGVDFADSPHNPPVEEVLDGVAAAGYEWMELGPYGYLPVMPGKLGMAVAARSLRVTASFLFESLADRSLHHALHDKAALVARWIAGAGGRFLVIIDAVDGERQRTAGRSEDAQRLSGADWEALLEGVNRVSERAREHGLRPVFHPHAGSHVEFVDEIDRLMRDLPDLELCLDTGHAAFAGIDPGELYERHWQRVPYLHLKDVDPAVRRRVVDQRLGFWEAIRAGIFCPLGEGTVDFGAFQAALAARGFEGWAMVEQDVDASCPGDCVADAAASRRYLEQVGLATPDGQMIPRS
jgi:inosose dehydratase